LLSVIGYWLPVFPRHSSLQPTNQPLADQPLADHR
jgi:hypothetical protein